MTKSQLCTRRANGLLQHSADRKAVWSGKTDKGTPLHLCANCRAYDLARQQAAHNPTWLGGRGISDSAVLALSMLLRGPVSPGAMPNYRNDRVWFWLRTWERLGLVTRQAEKFTMAGGAK